MCQPHSTSEGPVRCGTVDELETVLHTWLTDHDQGEGIAAVIATDTSRVLPNSPRIRLLTPQLAKGLEFDLVVLIDPAHFGTGIEGTVDHYVAMTRATHQLVILNS